MTNRSEQQVQVIRGVECRIRRIPAARRLTLTIHYDGTVLVTVPKRVTKNKVLSFVWSNFSFIEDQLALLEEYRRPLYESPPKVLYQGRWYRVRLVKGDEWKLRFFATHFVFWHPRIADLAVHLQQHWIDWSRRKAKRILPELIRSLAQEVGVQVERISIRNQRSRWGSCTAARRSISLNWRAILFPSNVLEYLIYHELAHLRYPHHGKRYWQLVESWMPEYRECERWISVNGPAIMALTTVSKRRHPIQFELFAQQSTNRDHS